jgi:hypothetical protein
MQCACAGDVGSVGGLGGKLRSTLRGQAIAKCCMHLALSWNICIRTVHKTSLIRLLGGAGAANVPEDVDVGAVGGNPSKMHGTFGSGRTAFVDGASEA